MEFPTLGRHCAHPPCSRLDFLPIKCDLCQDSFCSEHVKAAAHECTGEGSRDLQVPVCPLCGGPVPGRRGERPDVAMNLHIENECRNISSKVYRNRCSFKGCRVRELVSIKCPECGNNYCLKHRHSIDHDCDSPGDSRPNAIANSDSSRLAPNSRNNSNSTSNKKSSKKGYVARESGANANSNSRSIRDYTKFGLMNGNATVPSEKRTSSTNVNSSSEPGGNGNGDKKNFNPENIQGSMSEDEALARALQESMDNSARSNNNRSCAVS